MSSITSIFPQEDQFHEPAMLDRSQEQSRDLLVTNVYDPFVYPWMCLNFFLALYTLGSLLYFGLSMRSSPFVTLDEDKKRNVVTYAMQFLVTLLAFILQIYGGKDVLFLLSDDTTLTRLNCMVLAAFCVACLYVWEMCYRTSIGWALLTHHFVTLILLQCANASFYETGNIAYVRYCMLLGFHATTEQLSFVALACFRLGWFARWQGFLFYAATLQALILKTLVTFAAFAFFIRDAWVVDTFGDDPARWDMFWKVLFLPLLAILYASQLYACNILYSLGRRCSINGGSEKPASFSSKHPSRFVLRPTHVFDQTQGISLPLDFDSDDEDGDESTDDAELEDSATNV